MVHVHTTIAATIKRKVNGTVTILCLSKKLVKQFVPLAMAIQCPVPKISQDTRSKKFSVKIKVM